MSSDSYADMEHREFTSTFGEDSTAPVWIGSQAFWEKTRKWLRGEWCPHPRLHDALIDIALELACPPQAEPGLNTLLDSVFEGKRPPDEYWGEKLHD